MLCTLARLFREILTRNDNQTFDETKVGGFIVILTGCFLCIWLVVGVGRDFDANSFFWGSAAVLGAMGGLSIARDKVTPDPPRKGK